MTATVGISRMSSFLTNLLSPAALFSSVKSSKSSLSRVANPTSSLKDSCFLSSVDIELHARAYRGNPLQRVTSTGLIYLVPSLSSFLAVHYDPMTSLKHGVPGAGVTLRLQYVIEKLSAYRNIFITRHKQPALSTSLDRKSFGASIVYINTNP